MCGRENRGEKEGHVFKGMYDDVTKHGVWLRDGKGRMERRVVRDDERMRRHLFRSEWMGGRWLEADEAFWAGGAGGDVREVLAMWCGVEVEEGSVEVSLMQGSVRWRYGTGC